MWRMMLIALALAGGLSGCYYDPYTGLTYPYPPYYGYPYPPVYPYAGPTPTNMALPATVPPATVPPANAPVQQTPLPPPQ